MTSVGQPTASRESSEFEFVHGQSEKELTEKHSGVLLIKEQPPLCNPTSSSPTAENSEDPGLFGWVKGGSGILSKVAEKTKSSVESVIMVLDPQMKGKNVLIWQEFNNL